MPIDQRTQNRPTHITYLLTIASTIIVALILSSPAAAHHETPPIMISEVMVTGCSDGDMTEEDDEWQCRDGHELAHKEFVVLHNPSNEDIYLDGWQLDSLFSTKSHAATIAELQGTLPAGEYALFTFALEGTAPPFSYGVPVEEIDGTFTSGRAQGALQNSGYVQLSDQHGVSLDRFGWGTMDDADVDIIPAGYSAKRFLLPGDDAHDYYVEFEVSYPTTPQGGGFTPGPPDEASPCEAVRVSEVLTNPSGHDEQYVEMHNPTSEAISLAGCGLQRNGANAIHRFTNEDIVPAQSFQVWHAPELAIRLSKTVASTLYYLSPYDVELQTVEHPELDEGQSWAWFGGNDWRATYTPTPGAENIYRADKPMPPCPAGQERNPETNRCRKAGGGDGLKPCRPGQERNPDTNRCRSTGADSSSLKPCRPGQERNPETNRCRKIGGDSSNLKPCAPNQERNPETNRCRKKANLAGAATPVDDISSTKENTVAWWAAGAALASVAGYGIWEWRRSIAALFRRVFLRSTE